jgi:hypothetical protein
LALDALLDAAAFPAPLAGEIVRRALRWAKLERAERPLAILQSWSAP